MAITKPGPATLTLPKRKEAPNLLRYVPVQGRYILQEKHEGRWRNVPLVSSESAAVSA